MRKALFAVAVASSLAAAPSSLLGSLQALLDSVWHTGPITKEGCGMDPNGRCTPAPTPQMQADAGCGMDPDGRCKSGS